MKRLIAIALLLCMVLSGCAQKEVIDPGTEIATQPTTQPATQPTTEPPTEETVEPTEEVTEPVVEYRHPLTGEPLEEPYTGRPITVSLGNTRDALPQLGISKADVMYEIETEGGITRFMPIFTNYEFDDPIGPVRSARTYYNNISASYDACIAHCGGSVRGIAGYYDLLSSKIPNWVHLDQRYNGAYFYRDQARRSAGYLLEHTMCTTGNKLIEAMTARDYINDVAYDYGFQFAEDENLSITGEAASKVIVSFLGGKDTTFVYDPEQAVYTMNQYNDVVIDGNTNEEITFKNLIVIYSPQSKKHDGYYSRSYYELIGSGDGYFAVNGQIVPIKWSRAELTSPFSYTLEDGTPITMGVGTTYVGVASPKSDPISYE